MVALADQARVLRQVFKDESQCADYTEQKEDESGERKECWQAWGKSEINSLGAMVVEYWERLLPPQIPTEEG